MADPFQYSATGTTSPAQNAFSISPNDGADLSLITRAVWVGTGGNIVVILNGDTSAVTLTNIPDGTLLPIRAKRINATNTTASGLVGLY